MIRRDLLGADDAERVKQLIYYAFNNMITFEAASRLPNRRSFPVVMSPGCETGEFVPYIAWNVRYRDVQGQLHCMVETGIGATPVRDTVDGSLHAAPYAVPLPPPYDVDAPPGGRSMASAFLFARTPDGSPSGGIAYMGEMLSLPPTSADEFQAAALKAYHQDGLCVLGDVWQRAQLALWSSNKDAGQADPSFGPPRIYLSIMHLFGDPTLRIRRIHRLIWKNPSGVLSVWNVDDAGRQVTCKEHGHLRVVQGVRRAAGLQGGPLLPHDDPVASRGRRRGGVAHRPRRQQDRRGDARTLQRVDARSRRRWPPPVARRGGGRRVGVPIPPRPRARGLAVQNRIRGAIERISAELARPRDPSRSDGSHGRLLRIPPCRDGGERNTRAAERCIRVTPR